MHFGEIKYFDVGNGPGIRTSIFVSGCSHHCKGCFNPETWDKNYGKEFNEEIEEVLKSLSNPHIQGLSFLGGDPLEPYNLKDVKTIIDAVRLWDSKKTIWMWTGNLFEELTKEQLEIVKLIDVLVDGPFIEEEKNLMLPYCGSSNQRVIDIPNTLKEKRIVLYTNKID